MGPKFNINTSATLKVDAYPDSDFAGLYGHEKPTDPACSEQDWFPDQSFLFPCAMDFKVAEGNHTFNHGVKAEVNSLAHCYREIFPVMNTGGEIGSVIRLPAEDMASMYI